MIKIDSEITENAHRSNENFRRQVLITKTLSKFGKVTCETSNSYQTKLPERKVYGSLVESVRASGGGK